MSHLMDLIRGRASVRSFDSRPVTPECMAESVEAARWAPSACNSQPWRFVAVIDPDVRAGLVRDCLGGLVPNRWASAAPAFLVACAERKLVPHLLAEPLSGIAFHQLDLGIALEHAALRAVELGLGSCYIGWFRARPLSRLLGLPHGWKIVCLLALGYPSGETPRRDRLPLDRILFFNRVSTIGRRPTPLTSKSPDGLAEGNTP